MLSFQSFPGSSVAVRGTALFLEYDYGSTSRFSITCMGMQSNVAVNVGEYPRYKPADPVADFAEYFPPAGSINLDVDWISYF